MGGRHAVPLSLAALVVGAVATCGGTAPAATDRPEAAPVPTSDLPTLEPEVRISGSCIDDLGPFTEALMELDSRLAIGMPFVTYSEYVADAQVVYDRIDIPALVLDPACLTGVAVPAEAALTNYVYAYRIWNACMDKSSCTLDDVEPKLQDYWAKATAQIDEFRFLVR